MVRLARFFFGAMALALFAAAPSSADSPSVWGTIFHCPNGNCSTHSGDRTLLHSSVNQHWFGPAFTDDQGVYAFYDIPDGQYVLYVYGGDGKETRRNVQSIPQHLDPIQL